VGLSCEVVRVSQGSLARARDHKQGIDYTWPPGTPHCMGRRVFSFHCPAVIRKCLRRLRSGTRTRETTDGRLRHSVARRPVERLATVLAAKRRGHRSNNVKPIHIASVCFRETFSTAQHRDARPMTRAGHGRAGYAGCEGGPQLRPQFEVGGQVPGQSSNKVAHSKPTPWPCFDHSSTHQSS